MQKYFLHGYLKWSLLLFLIINAGWSYAQSSKKDQTDFEPKDVIFDHILDNHEWHIATYQGRDIAIPLPVILFSEGKLYTFMSNRLTNGQVYQGFKLMDEKPYKGKIVSLEKNEQGKEIIKAKLPLDFSITKNVFALIFSSILMSLIFFSVAKKYKKRTITSPKGLQALVEPVILFIRDEVVFSNMRKDKGEKYLPYLLTLFFFILINNLLGMIPIFPGGANLMGNIAVTGILALITFILTMVNSNKHYWTDIFNSPQVPWWLKFLIPLMPIIEIFGIFTKPFVLMIRLFANMTAGHIVGIGFIIVIFVMGQISPLIGFGFTPISILFSLFVGLLELLVAFVQAYVFVLLTSIYLGMASADPHAHK